MLRHEAGRRGQAWIKIKRAFATLDVVVTAAEEGHGRRAGILSDYTFGVWKDEAIVNIGKAYSGLTDDEIDALSRTLERLSRLEGGGGRFGSVRTVPPSIVLEVAFDGVQLSSRHKSGYALRFPRIVRIRNDKTPEQADRLDAVVALFRAQVETGHREDAVVPPARRTAKRKAGDKSHPSQLDLFAKAEKGPEGHG